MAVCGPKVVNKVNKIVHAQDLRYVFFFFKKYKELNSKEYFWCLVLMPV